ncbi:MAG: hypothetical protein ACRDTE_19290 [Pseudonocardiaceae bacterium]
MERWEEHISAIAALDEPTRRGLYDYVVRQPAPVSRDDAATALDRAAAHDRGVSPRPARGGGPTRRDLPAPHRTHRPGAGRSTKLYQRSDQHVAVSLPQRRYDLVGQLLAGALEHAERSGDSPGKPSTSALR